MQALACEVLRVEPVMESCATERITSELYRCSRNNNICKYGLYAGKTSTYCLHPNNTKFVKLSSREQIYS